VCAAAEPVTTAFTEDAHLLARAAYHLGNRHVALQIGEGWVRYLANHVLDAMVGKLGLVIVHEERPFEPEVGAYSGSSHNHRGEV
ncbi:MAG TPA: urease accessory protein UreE, partial [Gammaproteobacteria bacterium]|nr:urease accessory protein UreE [Gammaproteobacteria bacterium]